MGDKGKKDKGKKEKRKKAQLSIKEKRRAKAQTDVGAGVQAALKGS